MATRKKPLPTAGTLPDLLLTLTALSGEFPTSLVSRLPASGSYKAYTVKQLKRENLLRTYYHAGLRGLRLTSTAKHLLTACRPEQYRPLFTGDSTTNAPKYSAPHRLRLHRMAEVLVTMYQAGVASFPWEKPAVFQSTPPMDGLTIEYPSYYSSREVKEIGEQAIKIRGSRATGILLANGSIFMVYNTGSVQMKWEYKAELRLKAMLMMELCQHRLVDQFSDATLCGIVFGDGMGELEHLMGAGNRQAHNYFVLDGSLSHFYYLTNDHRGELVIQLLCDPELRTALNEILTEGLSERRPGWPVENDAMDEGGSPVLIGYTCDMPRIRRFDTALELHEQTGTLFCFDFQAEALRRVCGPRVTLQSIDFSAFERSVYPYPANS